MKHVTILVLLGVLGVNMGMLLPLQAKSKHRKPMVDGHSPARLVSSPKLSSRDWDTGNNTDRNKSQERVIMTLQTRDHLLTIYTSDKGYLYSVDAKDGMRLAERLTPDELKELFPSLHEIVNEGVATDSPMADAPLH
jgi:hypothetical protein